jgi:4-hydroxy-2-oxoheptanedioate aldolase
MSALASAVLRNPVKEKLARNALVASMTVRLVGGTEIARIAKTAGFDSLYVDLEHSSLSLQATAQICMAALDLGLAPFVRVPANAPHSIGRVLDGGALGVIAPGVNSPEAARAIVAAAKFPPLGQRGAAGALPHLHYRAVLTGELYSIMNAATMVIVQFESAEAVARADEILAVAGVDMALLGANDLMADLGRPGDYDDPRLHDAYAQTIAAARRVGKHVGVGGLSTRPDLVQRFVAMGARYVSTGTDLQFLLGAASARAAAVQTLAESR